MAHCRKEAANEFGKVERGEQGKQVYGMMGDCWQIFALIFQLVYIIFFFFQATSMYLENKYLFEGFMVSIKSGFLKLGQKNRTMILPSGNPGGGNDIYFQNIPCGLTNTDRALSLKTFPFWIIKALFETGQSRDHKVGCAQTTTYLHTQKHTKYSDGAPFILDCVGLSVMGRNQTKEDSAIRNNKMGLR